MVLLVRQIMLENVMFCNEKIFFESNNPLIVQILHFAKVIGKETKPLVSGLEGLKSLKVIEAVQKSSIIKKIVDIE